ncbi:MAG: MMPL family transporter [Pseudomonadota bacterium]|nr:MMPL family transporter [Pseudomonadota bacterium]
MKQLIWLVEACCRHARSVLVLTLIVTFAALYYTTTHFSMDTDTSGILSDNLPFQRLEHSYHQAFPQTRDTLVVVINGDTSALTAQALKQLEVWVNSHPDEFTGSYSPGNDEFFHRNGLLFLDPDALQKLSSRIIMAQPLIARLGLDPTLHGLFNLLDTAIQQGQAGGQQIMGLTNLFNQLTETVQAQEQGRFQDVRWGAIIGGESVSSSSQDRQQFLILNPRLNHHSMQPAAGPIHDLRVEIGRLHLDAAHGVQIGLTGGALLDSEQIETVSKGAAMALTLTLGFEVLLLLFALRSIRLVISVLASLLSGMILTTALALIFIGPFNLLSIAFAILFIGLGVDLGIQFCLRYKEELHKGVAYHLALRRVAAGLGGALSLATVAAAISFFSFVPTKYAGMIDLGMISGTSMFIALLATFTILPALLTLWPLKGRPAQQGVIRMHSSLPIERHPIHLYGRWILGVSFILCLAGIPLAAHVRFDFNPLNMISPDSEGVRVFHQLLSERNTTPYRIEAVTSSLSSAKQMASRLERIPEVSQAITLASFVPARQQEKLAVMQNLRLLVPPFFLGAQASTPASGADQASAMMQFESRLRDLVSEKGVDPELRHSATSLMVALHHFQVRFKGRPQSFIELQRRIMGGLKVELENLNAALNAGPVTLASLPESLRSRYISPDGQARVEVFPRENMGSESAMRRFVTAVQAVAPEAVGTPVMLVEGGKAVADAFHEATVIALALIVCLLLVALRRGIDVVLVMVPLLLASVYTVAAMVLLGWPFNLGNIIVLPLLIGLGVAFAIYLVARWRQGVTIAHLLQTSTPVAIFFSGVTTLSSFGSMAISSDPGMASLGKTLTLALLMILLCVLIVLPALLMLFTPSPKEEIHDTEKHNQV